ncbi:MAG: right-handed parallel beta-helix repeat-containing protein [Chloroflexota bacterium]|nr:right-handed parallel beta-helix repeat-containing protein [Chloroflexota bacterium]MDE2946772.1 right-handed parallel beta-helix repeat-containing protein [Chloroflexota bacterium]
MIQRIIIICLGLLACLTALAQAEGIQYFVSPAGDNDNSGASPSLPFRSIQHALQLAQPGDTIHLGPGHYYQDVYTVRDGEPGKPITIVGASKAVVHGAASNRIFQVHHDYISLVGFTIDGLRRNAEPNRMGAFREKLLYVIGYDARDGVHHLRVLNMTFRNAGEECLRIKYFARHNEIAYSRFHDCGIWDFVFDAHGVVGEAIYLGTSSKQWDINLTIEPDITAHNWVHHNVIDTQGNECVEAKEGSEYNIIEYNLCTGQKDPNSGGIVSRGKGNVIRYNEIHGSVGAGIRLGGHLVDGVQYGVENRVYGNIIYENDAGGIKALVAGQALICGNQLRDNAAGAMTGDAADLYDGAQPCASAAIDNDPASR